MQLLRATAILSYVCYTLMSIHISIFMCLFTFYFMSVYVSLYYHCVLTVIIIKKLLTYLLTYLGRPVCHILVNCSLKRSKKPSLGLWAHTKVVLAGLYFDAAPDPLIVWDGEGSKPFSFSTPTSSIYRFLCPMLCITPPYLVRHRGGSSPKFWGVIAPSALSSPSVKKLQHIRLEKHMFLLHASRVSSHNLRKTKH